MENGSIKLKILHLEDLATDAELVSRILLKSDIKFELKWVSNKTDYIEALNTYEANILLSDHSLPTLDSFEALQLARAHGVNVPFILITSTVSEEYAVEIMKEGAYDYVLKDRLQRLPRAITNAFEKWKIEEEKKEYYELIRVSEERYRQIVETAQEGIWMIDDNNKTVFVNKRMCEMLEYSSDEMMGKPNYYFMEGKINQVSDPNSGQDALDIKLLTKSQEVVWVSLSNSPVLDNDGNYIGALAMVTDITNKRLYEESLRNSEANIRTILENTTTGYVLLDMYFTIISFNHIAEVSYERELGRPLRVGENLLEYFYGERKRALQETYIEVLNGRKSDYETYFVNPDGSKVWYYVQFSQVLDVNKKLLGIVIAANDITERKEMDLQREKITEDLIQRNKDLEQFAYIVSHNLRAPVANILGISNILSAGNVNPEVLKGLSNSVQKLDEVILDLNDILQIRRELSERKEKVVFSKLVDDIKTSMASQLSKGNVEINVNFDQVDELLTVKSYIHSIFSNLISNSIKYSQPNVSARIEIESVKKKNNIELHFKDNGMGIDLKRRGDQVFGLYKRFHTETTEGKGIGLFMVKTQVEALGGKIAIASEVNKGTEFSITL
ncbi:MAG TPA: PAS domain S-box protein [Cyclobacteriaceae bacterium]